MAKITILNKLVNTQINNDQTKEILSKIIRKEFDQTKDEEKAFELLIIAFKYNLSCFYEMLCDYELADFKWF